MADVLDILTEAEARAAVNVTTGHDLELAVMVTGVSRRIDDLCGPVVVRTITDERHDPDGGIIFLRHYPVQSITEVTEYQSGTGTVLTGEDLTTAGGYLLRDGLLARRSGFASVRWYGPTVVTYVAGRYPTTETVDAKFKLAASAILRRLWQREAAAWARGGDPFALEDAGGAVGFFRAVDPMVQEFLGSEMLGPVVA